MNGTIKKVQPVIAFILGYILYYIFKSFKFLGVFYDTGFSKSFFDIFPLIMLMLLCTFIVFYFIKYYSLDELFLYTKDKKIFFITFGLVFFSFIVFPNLNYFKSSISNFQIFSIKITDYSKFSFIPFITSFNYLISSIIFVPILEEILFRGILQKYITKIIKNKNPLIAITIVSISFSIMHWQFEKILFYFLCGFLFGYIYHKTQRIIIPIIGHSFWNLLNVLFVMDLQIMNRSNSLLFLIFIIAFVFFAKFLHRYEIICKLKT